ncbi:ATP-binding protein [Sinanaerobacter chloroacetimidivorans]|uniref:4Fe-4S binding protein n=1 Tax=Sinanaerobacter chloroacetimidivorans TaxID=2818044 RepID=A0A8J8AZQ8_9FIRM|nr:4Fe-4S binding protein [Sinanaerobacter chloroacetimidivorans]MBR0596439.1 4Fe-4S binding protein [Sinanaerobacter chloroacetimidivorans]
MAVENTRIEKAFIDPTKCIGCGACILHCPAQAIYMMPRWVSYVNQEKCMGCGKCVELCHRNAPSLYQTNK